MSDDICSAIKTKEEMKDIHKLSEIFLEAMLASRIGSIVITTGLNSDNGLNVGVQSNLGGASLTLKLLKECVSKLEEDLSRPAQ